MKLQLQNISLFSKQGIESNLYMNIGQTFSCFEQHGVDFGKVAEHYTYI